jgi:hypothetical protein
MVHVAKLFAPWCTTWGLQCFFFSKTHNYKIKVWDSRLCHFLDHNVWHNLLEMITHSW